MAATAAPQVAAVVSSAELSHSDAPRADGPAAAARVKAADAAPAQLAAGTETRVACSRAAAEAEPAPGAASAAAGSPDAGHAPAAARSEHFSELEADFFAAGDALADAPAPPADDFSDLDPGTEGGSDSWARRALDVLALVPARLRR